MVDLVIKNARLVLPDKIVEAGLVVEDGKIRQITDDLPEAKSVVDAAGKHVLPGLIDVHVHFREPGSSSKEDWETGSSAAAAGGVTTVFDMPNTQPPTTTLKQLEAKRSLVKGRSKVDYGFHFGASLDNISELSALGEDVASVKFYTSATTGNLRADNDAIIYEELKLLAQKGIPVTTHAENSDMVNYWAEKLKEKTDPSAEDYAASRPNVCAASAMNQMIFLSKMAHNSIHFCHVSTKEEVALLKEFKSPAVTAEVTPHHLFLSEENIADLKNFSKVNPPLRKEEDVDALWAGISEGLIEVVATDHAPHLPEEKNRPILEASSGLPGLETMLPLLLDAVNRGDLELLKVAKLTSQNPAEIFSIKNKGRIAEGFDADLVIVDMEREAKVDNERLFTKCKWSPFSGWELKGWPVKTFVRGKLVFDEGTVHENLGSEVSYL